ncbi:hypothetical protein LCGC14_0616860 [marine sediment metagenome]|uniref:Uncharacterized protein n=1 Tax=marine sediment metagenome TaxID=412755 RepID=A0A0F9RAW0_9ZZZZ
MSIIVFNPFKVCSDYRYEQNMKYLVDGYLWVTTGKSIKGLNYSPMMREPVVKVKKGGKSGWKKGRKRSGKRGMALKRGK